MLPNFIIVGAEKAGTTSLASLLSSHPQVFMCEPKEPRFFSDHNWEKGIRWYEALFEGANGCKAIGEASPAYTWAPESDSIAERIKTALGDIKYIYIVRDPVERMISHYRHALLYRWIPNSTSFEDSLQLLPSVKNCSRYYYQISRYLGHTDKGQWHILSLENLKSDPQHEMNRLFEFLEIEKKSFEDFSSMNSSDEKGQRPRFIDSIQKIQSFVPKPIVQVGKKIMDKYGKKIERPELSNHLKNELYKELEEDIEKLESFCGQSFQSAWRNKKESV